MSDDDAKKWRRDVGLNSIFANTRPALPRLLALLPLAASLTALAVCLPPDLRPLALRSCGIGLGAYLTTIHLVPVISKKIPKSKFGCDLLKRPPRLQIDSKDKTIPESLGLVSGVVFVLALVVADAVEADDTVDAHTLAAATLAIALAILLGFADDVLDLEWRYKYALPPLMALPLLAAYDGGTVIRPPVLVRRYLTDTFVGDVADNLLGLFGGAIVPEAMGLVDLGRAYQVSDSEQKMNLNLTWSRRWRLHETASPRRRRRGRQRVLASRQRAAAVSRRSPFHTDLHGFVGCLLHERGQHLRRREWLGVRPGLCHCLFHPDDGRHRITTQPVGELHAVDRVPAPVHRHDPSSVAEQLVPGFCFCGRYLYELRGDGPRRRKISASRGAAVPSRRRRDSCLSDEAVGGFFSDFEAIRTASSDRDAPRR